MSDVNGVMLSDDLIFFSRVAGTARANGLVVKQTRTADELLRRVGETNPGGVLLDLHNETLDLPAVLASLKTIGVRSIAYGSHVDAARLRSAREAGCDLVMPRSQFVDKLETDLATWLKRG